MRVHDDLGTASGAPRPEKRSALETTEIPVEGFEKVVRGGDPASGLRAFIAVHDTTLGPALGGMRMWPYASEEEALVDVLRLARGMTYKSALAETGLGGGKSVVMGDPEHVRCEALYLSMGRFIESLGGLYITAEDVNTSLEDLEVVRRTTRHVSGLSREQGGSGNPSPYTALGCFLGIQECLRQVHGGDGSPKGRTVAVQGVGAVGRHLALLLAEAGAEVLATDLDEARVRALQQETGARAVPPEEIYAVRADIFSPCALGAVLNDKTIPRLRCRIVAGAANNQLLEERHGEALMQRGILYAPDFVINSGGIINVSCEFLPGGYDERRSLEKIRRIPIALRETFGISSAMGIPTNKAAHERAEQILAEARGG